jgi:hypothetical protein
MGERRWVRAARAAGTATAVLGILAATWLLPVSLVSAATSTLFSPTTVTLAAGGPGTTITISATGIANPNTNSAQFGLIHSGNLAVSNVQCTGIFSGATVFQNPTATGTSVGCTLSTGQISGPTGPVLTFTLTRTAGTATESVSFDPNPALTLYASPAGAESVGTTNTVTVQGAAPPTTVTPSITPTNTLTPTPTFTFTPLPVVTPTFTFTPTVTPPAPTLVPLVTATATPTQTPGTVLNTNPPLISGGGQPACDSPDDVLTVSGGVTGTGGNCGSFTLTLTAMGPVGTVIGSTPRVFIPVVNLNTGATSVVSFLCSQTVPATRIVTCAVTDTVPGEVPVQGGIVTIRFQTATGTADVTGTITGPGGVLRTAAAPLVLPLLPPPPPPLLLPPLPPPLALPPPGSFGAQMAAGPPARAMMAPEVPVIPEADTLLLLAVGMAGLGTLATLRAWRRRKL